MIRITDGVAPARSASPVKRSDPRKRGHEDHPFSTESPSTQEEARTSAPALSASELLGLSDLLALQDEGAEPQAESEHTFVLQICDALKEIQLEMLQGRGTVSPESLLRLAQAAQDTGRASDQKIAAAARLRAIVEAAKLRY